MSAVASRVGIVRCGLLTLVAATQLSGCFIFIPGAVIDKGADLVTGQKGDHCVSTQAKVGDHIMLSGKNATIMELMVGTSRRCLNPQYPVRAAVRFDADAE